METLLDRPVFPGEDSLAERPEQIFGGLAAPAAKPPVPKLEFWEAEHTQPAQIPRGSDADYSTADLEYALQTYLPGCMQHPFLPRAEIEKQQLARIRELVELAYETIPVYRDKYRAAGFSPSDLRTYADIEKIPTITKPELVAAFPGRCLNPAFKPDDLFKTRSSGSSGQTLLIRVNYDAVITDTIQGVRQFALQSGLKYKHRDLLTHVYTVPWWYPSIGEKYPSAFISNVIPPARVAQHLADLSPEILSIYPSNLDALMPHAEEFRDSLHLAVTHSEYSARSQRDFWSKRLGVPVLDEYSSEEATRIALELPCGHYHVCEDSVHLDVIDPETGKPQTPGKPGLSVITNLLNEAMPFIRYVQGDLITMPAKPEPCAVNWAQIESIEGRMNDAFVNLDGRRVPAGSLLDLTYRWMFDQNVTLAEFEIVQRRRNRIVARFSPGAGMQEAQLTKSVAHLGDLLAVSFEHPVDVEVEIVDRMPARKGKRRPIRCELAD
jgi:phenylacetate-CoA ligase